jgi:hypothetical protein
MTARQRTGIDGKVRTRGSLVERNERVIRLKEELNLILQLVVHSRESLENELNSEFAQKKLSVDKGFVAKLKDLTVCYNTLTAARISLDKAEKQLEKELSPEEEREVVRNYIRSLEHGECYSFLTNELEYCNKTSTRARKDKDNE